MKKTLYLAAALLTASAAAHAQTLADYANAGDAAYAAGKFQEAIDNYVKAQELDAENTDYLTAMQLGTAYQQVGENRKAGDAFKSSLVKGNPDGAVITNMKNAYEADGCTECVKQAYIDIKTINPHQTLAMDKKLYFIYTKEKDWDNALKCTLTELTDESLDQEGKVKLYKRAAQLYMNTNQADSAEVYYDKVLAITPDDADIHKALGYGLYNTIQSISKREKAKYENNPKKDNHAYAMMNTEIKRATLKYGPKALEHLRTANKTLNDAQITQIISSLDQNIKAYNARK